MTAEDRILTDALNFLGGIGMIHAYENADENGKPKITIGALILLEVGCALITKQLNKNFTLGWFKEYLSLAPILIELHRFLGVPDGMPATQFFAEMN